MKTRRHLSLAVQVRNNFLVENSKLKRDVHGLALKKNSQLAQHIKDIRGFIKTQYETKIEGLERLER